VTGKRILVVEDDPIYAMWIADLLKEKGATVLGPAGNLSSAARLVSEAEVALLDIQVGREMVWPLAFELRAAGVPVVFLSSYDGPAPEGLGDVPRVSKIAADSVLLDSLNTAGGGGLISSAA